MRDYSKVSSQFWTGKTGKMLRGDMQTQIVALYLMTSQHANMIGVFNCHPIYISHDTGSPLEGAMKGLKTLCEGGFCTYDDELEVVWVHEMAKYQIGDSLKASDNRVKDIQKQYENLAEGHIKQGFFEKYHVAFNLQNSKHLASPYKAPSKPEAGTEAGTGTGTGTGTTPRDESPLDVGADVPPAGVVLPQITPAGLFATELRKLGVSITSSHPILLAWVNDGFILPNIFEAVELARMTKPSPQSIPPGYLDAILRKPDPVGRPAIHPSAVTPLHDHRCRHEENGARCEGQGVRGKNGRWYCQDHKGDLEARA